MKAVRVLVHIPLSGKTMEFDSAGKMHGGVLIGRYHCGIYSISSIHAA